MNILVTGAAGFVGSNMCAQLLSEGHRVWAADNFTTGQRSHIEKLSSNTNFTFFEGGVETSEFVLWCKNTGITFEQVFHFACPTGVPNIQILGEEMLLACSEGVKNVLEIARASNAKFIETSSSEAYGDPLVFPQKESYTGNVDPIGWRANYEEGKRFSETWVKLYADKYKLDAKIVRLFNIYGPQMSRADFRVVPRFVTQALAGEPLTVHGDGSQERTMCYVDDLLVGLRLVLEQGKAGEVYNLGSDQSMTMLELAEKVIKLSGSASTIERVPRAAHDHQSRMPDLEKVRGLGWKQTVPFDEGMKRTIEYFAHS